MKFLSVGKDGGPKSPVTGYWLFEIKGFASIALLKFNPGVRENYHTHAFNAISWVLSGPGVTERRVYNAGTDEEVAVEEKFEPSMWPKVTKRNNNHKVRTDGNKPTWIFTIRGPWSNMWTEYNEDTKEFTELTHGRSILRKYILG